MSTRKWGFVLIVVGLSGLALTSTGWAMAPPGRWTMPGWMSQMHSWMHGSIQGREGAPPPSPGATEVRVVARDFSFSPDEVTVPVGRTVNLTLVNEGDLPHDITIPALGFRLPAAPGSTASGALTVMRAGSYEFFCSIPGHREAGMSGTLIAS